MPTFSSPAIPKECPLDTALSRYPRSAYDQVGGIVYFARMLDKIRLHQAGRLPAEYHSLSTGLDGRLCGFLSVEFAAVYERVRQGGSDEEVAEALAQEKSNSVLLTTVPALTCTA